MDDDPKQMLTRIRADTEAYRDRMAGCPPCAQGAETMIDYVDSQIALHDMATKFSALAARDRELVDRGRERYGIRENVPPEPKKSAPLASPASAVREAISSIRQAVPRPRAMLSGEAPDDWAETGPAVPKDSGSGRPVIFPRLGLGSRAGPLRGRGGQPRKGGEGEKPPETPKNRILGLLDRRGIGTRVGGRLGGDEDVRRD